MGAQKQEMSEKAFVQIIQEVAAYAESASDPTDLQNFIVREIADRLTYYNWTGFYMLDPDDPQTLVLGPFRGAKTEHVRISVSQGICGAAVAQDATVIVDDVTSDPRYLSCSIYTKSEVVVPIRVFGTIVGEIDVDSHEAAAFTQFDREFLEQCAAVVGRSMERLQNTGVSPAAQ
jgi:L-methionine (R)-S-oxide reductase